MFRCTHLPSAYILVVLIVLLISGCFNTTFPSDWPVTGLSLPPNAEIVKAYPGAGHMPGKKWAVDFNCTMSQQDVARHFKTKLKSLGYRIASVYANNYGATYIDSSDTIMINLWNNCIDASNDRSVNGDYSIWITVYDDPVGYYETAKDML